MFFRVIASRLRNRPDGEHEMILNRLAFSIAILGYVLVIILSGTPGMDAPLAIGGAYVAAAVLLFGHIVWSPGISVTRRLLAMLIDLGLLSCGLHYGGQFVAALYPFYLWIIFGNGFRFGVTYLYAATALSLAGFGLVGFTTEYWVQNQPLMLGLLSGLVILPLYAATLIRKLSDAKSQAEKANQAKSLFLASVSHELRTPLTAVIGMSDLLSGTKLDSQQHDMSRTIKASAQSLLLLIDDILDLSRLEAQQMPTNAVDFDLLDLLAEVQGMVAVRAREKGLPLGLHVTPSTPVRLHGDRRQLAQILINLAANAVKFTEHGAVTIAADGVQLDGADVRLRIEVSDTGIGISHAARDRIFENFTQADETIADRFGGTGLGLAISKQMVRLQGGEMGVESQLGAGSTFWFTLTMSRQADPELAAPGLEGVQIVMLSVGGAVADNLFTRLAAWCRNVMVASTMEQAMQLLRIAPPAGIRRRVVILDEGSFDADADSLAAAWADLDTSAVVVAVLISAAKSPGLPPMSIRRHFVSVVAPDAVGSELPAALRVAAAGGGGAQQPMDGAPPGEIPRAARALGILLVDDNRSNQKVIAKILETAGHTVQIAGNGEQALDILEESTFDLIIMDINMPVMGGIEATKLYRMMALGQPYVPIIGLTADATPAAASRCIEAGMDACATKPIEAARLLEIIDQFVPQPSQPQPVAQPARSVVTEISEHPRFQGGRAPAVDLQTLANLQVLGGRDFLLDLISTFLVDGSILIQNLHSSAATGDVQSFRDQMHALRSGAANVGAKVIYEMCVSGLQIGRAELLAKGEGYAQQIEVEFERARAVMLQYSAERTQSETRS
jgi:two-component system sensor histidine kinase RpfC